MKLTPDEVFDRLGDLGIADLEHYKDYERFAMYKCKHFKIEELVSEDTLKEHGEEECWKLFAEETLIMADGIREFFDVPVIINNWHKGGVFSNRGYRSPDSPIGAKNSAHKKGMALDCDVMGYSAEKARQKIIENKDNELLKYINRMEANVNWLHTDIIPVEKRILIFNP